MTPPTIQSKLREHRVPMYPSTKTYALLRAAADRLDAADGLALAVGLWVHKAWSRDDDAREDVVNALAAYREQPMTRPSDHDYAVIAGPQFTGDVLTAKVEQYVALYCKPRPRWMPEPLYRWLMSRVVLYETLPTVAFDDAPTGEKQQ